MTNEKEVEDLGRRLFKDRLGPLVFYPTSPMTERYDFSRDPSTSSAGKGEDDPDRPADLVLCLQSTLLGCEWMLGEWAKLKAILDQGQAWLSSDKLKAVRLLGKQPFDAIDDRDVAMVFLASFVLKADKGRMVLGNRDGAGRQRHQEIPEQCRRPGARIVKAGRCRQGPGSAAGDHRAGHGALDDKGRSPSRASPSDGGPGRRLPGF